MGHVLENTSRACAGTQMHRSENVYRSGCLVVHDFQVELCHTASQEGNKLDPWNFHTCTQREMGIKRGTANNSKCFGIKHWSLLMWVFCCNVFQVEAGIKERKKMECSLEPMCLVCIKNLPTKRSFSLSWIKINLMDLLYLKKAATHAHQSACISQGQVPSLSSLEHCRHCKW